LTLLASHQGKRRLPVIGVFEMCDIEKERSKIDTMIENAFSPYWYADVRNRDALVETAFRCLRDEYGGCCSDECMRSRCESHIARHIGRCAA
jgi:hypothetical protein